MNRIIASIFLVVSLSGPAMAWTRVQSASNGGFAAQSSGGVTFGAATTSGRLVSCHFYFQSITVTLNSVTDAGGDSVWTIRGPFTGSDNRSYIADTIVQTGFSSPQGNFSGATTGDVLCAEYSGNATSSYLDCISAGGSGTGTALDGGGCSPTYSDSLHIGAGGSMANSVTYTAGGSYTNFVNEAHSSQGNSVAMEDDTTSSCSTVQATMTGSTSATWNMVTVAYKSNSPVSCGAGGGSGNLIFWPGSSGNAVFYPSGPGNVRVK